MDNRADDETRERLAAAEASMERQLSRVEKETAEVEKAMADLKRVKAELDAEASGNVFKPAALAGVLLFSMRAVLDFVAMTGGGIDAEAHLTAALVQGAIALICAAVLFFLK
jgi:multidrug resistance efflux pump